jgi:hypothetical protein
VGSRVLLKHWSTQISTQPVQIAQLMAHEGCNIIGVFSFIFLFIHFFYSRSRKGENKERKMICTPAAVMELIMALHLVTNSAITYPM